MHHIPSRWGLGLRVPSEPLTPETWKMGFLMKGARVPKRDWNCLTAHVPEPNDPTFRNMYMCMLYIYMHTHDKCVCVCMYTLSWIIPRSPNNKSEEYWALWMLSKVISQLSCPLVSGDDLPPPIKKKTTSNLLSLTLNSRSSRRKAAEVPRSRKTLARQDGDGPGGFRGLSV